MSWLDALKKQVLDSLATAAAPAPAGADAPPPAGAPSSAGLPDLGGALDGVIAMVREKGLGQIGQMFETGGLKDVFASWVGKGANLPISADQLRKVLGGQLGALAAQFGVSEHQVSELLARVLPGMVDNLTPDGALPESTPDEPPAEAPAPTSF